MGLVILDIVGLFGPSIEANHTQNRWDRRILLSVALGPLAGNRFSIELPNIEGVGDGAAFDLPGDRLGRPAVVARDYGGFHALGVQAFYGGFGVRLMVPASAIRPMSSWFTVRACPWRCGDCGPPWA